MKINVRNLRRIINEEVRRYLLEGALGIQEEESRNILQQFRNDIESVLDVDVDQLKPMGVGTRGIAFDAGGDRILKVTRDEKEAMISSALIGNNNESLTRYYEVVQFGDTGIYGILQEKLEPLTQQEVKDINDALIKTRFPVWLYKSDYDFDKAKQMTKDFLAQQNQKLLDSGDVAELRRWGTEMNYLWNLISRKYNMRGLAEVLEELGIRFHDYHGGNFMRRGNTLVLIDVGNARSFGGSTNVKVLKPNIQEARRRTGIVESAQPRMRSGVVVERWQKIAGLIN